ncbi:hypothetical protein Nepgr_027810 [Nepenthes gracilis]|uniref:Uncharacterized protein n=1 Tax=Nepenthes gracilis TaxID=150966 RepID=A0AAD3TCE4_NEPGR|nr:hypothetical protein Nepgr_027810 [Nepenthes gracilis]
MLKLCLMASHGFTPGLVLYHQQDCPPLLSISQSKQKIMRSDILNLMPHHSGDQCNHISGFAGSNQFVEADSLVRIPVLINVQDTQADSFFHISGNAEQCARHEKKICQFLMSASSGKEQDGLDLSHLSNLMSLEAIKICMLLQYAARTDFGSENSIMLKPSLFYPSGNLCSQKHLENLMDDFLCHSAVSVNPDGHISIIGTTADMKNWASVLGEFYFLKESAQQRKQTMLVPYFRWTDIKENQTDMPGFSLKLETSAAAPLRSLEKVDIRRAPKKKSKKKASKARDLYMKNYSSACESLLSFMTEKQRDGKLIIRSLKKSGSELPQLLTQISASIAGTGLAVIFSVICKMASGKAPLSTTKLVTTGFGFGLFWLSWAVNALRENVVYITKNSDKLGFKEEMMMKRIDKNVNDIFFGAAMLMAVAVLRLA